MLAFDRYGSGDPLLLLHGTMSSRGIWTPVLASLRAQADVIAVDLPGHGDSPVSSHTPAEWARDLAAFLDGMGLGRVRVVGHSSGGWAALELAKLGRASHVLALAPAGLWRRRSPPVADAVLQANWRLGRAAPGVAVRCLRSPLVRAIALRGISGQAARIRAEDAIVAARAAIAAEGFPEHFARTRRLRFTGGQAIDVPIRIVWGERDRIAPAARSRNLDQLPPHTHVETWTGAGHMLMWDAPGATSEAIDTLVSEGG